MTGILCWKAAERGRKPVLLREVSVLRMKMICAEVEAGERGTGLSVRRRVSKAFRKLCGAGCTGLILPPEFPWPALLETHGLQPVSTVPLRRMLAAELAEAVLTEKAGTDEPQIAVSAKQLSGDVVQAVTKLALRHRYVLLDVPYGGEDLCRQLRREYGVSLLLADAAEPAEKTMLLAFDPDARTATAGRSLQLWDEAQPLPPLLLPPALEAQLPVEYDRAQLLSVLMEAGIIRASQIAVGAGRAEITAPRSQ